MHKKSTENVAVVLGILLSAIAVAVIVIWAFAGGAALQQLAAKVVISWPWYVVRGAGIVAAASLAVLMLSGMGMVTGHTFRLLEPITAWVSHRALGIMFGVSVLIHMVGLLFDKFVSFSLADLLVPWTSSYNTVTIFGIHVGSLYVALGVLAFYMVALIIVTSLVWVEKKPYTWKLIHLLSYMVLVFVFVHALYLGTDLASGWLRWLWIALGAAIAGAAMVRLWRARTT